MQKERKTAVKTNHERPAGKRFLIEHLAKIENWPARLFFVLITDMTSKTILVCFYPSQTQEVMQRADHITLKLLVSDHYFLHGGTRRQFFFCQSAILYP